MVTSRALKWTLTVALVVCSPSAFAQSTQGSSPSGTAPGPASPNSSTNPSAPLAPSPNAAPGGELPMRSPSLHSTVPQPPSAVPPVPSAGNAEPNSPIYRQPPTTTNNAPSPSTSTPSEQPQPQPSTGVTGRSAPNDDKDTDLDVSGTRSPNTISEEPARVQREGGAVGQSLEGCLNAWDASTHLTRDQWQKTCERLGR